ncbi:MAG TPA: hypothetical protein VMM77_12445 [Gemmatimonadaceae bacterium]|nr:hypothetical protein [Gemmatimonadaceae bacterium]
MKVFSSEPSLTVPEILTVEAGETRYHYSFGAVPVPSSRSATVTVSAEFGGQKESKSAILELYPAQIIGIEVSQPQDLVNIPLGGADVPMKLRLSKAGGGMNVNLFYSGETGISGPRRIQIDGQATHGNPTEASFTVRLQPCPTEDPCTVTIEARGPPIGSEPNTVTRSFTLTRQ